MFRCSKFSFCEILVICVITKTFVQKSGKTNATNHSSLNGAMYVYTDLTLTDNLFFVFEAFPFYSKNIVWFVCFIDAHIRHKPPPSKDTFSNTYNSSSLPNTNWSI